MSSSHPQIKQILSICKKSAGILRVSSRYQQLVVLHLEPVLEHGCLVLDIHSRNLKSFLNYVKV